MGKPKNENIEGEILEAIRNLGSDAYIVKIREYIKSEYATDIGYGWLYNKLSQMKMSEKITSSLEKEAKGGRGGKRKKIYKVKNQTL